MNEHHLRPARENLHGAFKPDMDAAVTVEPRDTVVFHDTLDVSWGIGQHVRGERTRPKWQDRGGPMDYDAAVMSIDPVFDSANGTNKANI